jgi:hypothetical protein
VTVDVATGLLTPWITVGSTNKFATFENGAASEATNGVAAGDGSGAPASAVGSSNSDEFSTESLSPSAAAPKERSPNSMLDRPVIAAKSGAYGPEAKLATLGLIRFNKPVVINMTAKQATTTIPTR